MRQRRRVRPKFHECATMLLAIALASCVEHWKPPHVPGDLAPPAPVDPCLDAFVVRNVSGLRDAAAKGSEIAIDSVPHLEPVDEECDALGCVEGDCCYKCHSPYGAAYDAILDEGPYHTFVKLSGIAGNCSGYVCEQLCTPFGSDPTTTYRFVGTVTIPDGGFVLNVARYCRSSAQAKHRNE
jgi:hypothetical protein